MSSIRTSLSQAVVNTEIELAIPTGLTVDGRAGWSVTGVFIDFVNAALAVSQVEPLSSVTVELNTESGGQSYPDKDLITFDVFQFSGAVGAASFVQLDGRSRSVLPIPRLTAQPNLYVYLNSYGLVNPATIHVEVFYDIVKLSDLEVMRLLQGGA